MHILRRPSPRMRILPVRICSVRPTRLACLALIALGATAQGAAAQGPVQPHYWKQRLFFIPYQPNSQDPLADNVDKVQLLVSRAGAPPWTVLQEAQSHARGFSYHAPADGEYAFALRMVDRRGNAWPEQIVQPLLRVIVDTTLPTVVLQASPGESGQIVLHYEARDASEGKLKPESLRLEVQAESGAWQRLPTGPPDLSEPGRLSGQAVWQVPTSRGARFRATVEDAAGNVATAETAAPLAGPVLDGAAGPPMAPLAAFDDASRNAPSWREAASPPAALSPAAASPVGIDWPTSNSTSALASSSSRSTPGSLAHRDAPPPLFAPPDDPFVAASAASTASAEGSARGQLASTGAAPPLLSQSSPPASQPASGWTTTASPSQSPASGADAQAAAPTPWVNSLSFDVDYDIQTVGPWGVAKVQLWGTRDGGQQWINLGVDPDNRSPMRVTVPTAGVYGFRMVVDGGNGAAAPAPLAGDRPELMVGVDMTPPQAELRPAELGQGPLAGHLLVRWSAQDERLAARPVGLFYAASADGPWATVATDLDNTGEYAWQLLRDTPPRVVLRLEVRDAAGNVTVKQTPAPIELDLPRPSGRLRNVRPVQEPPHQFRTAAGAYSTSG
jgi:hypothetical protein